MANRESNYPAPAADRALNGQATTGETITSLLDLAKQGKPHTDEELETRLNDYFSFCGRSCIRPSIETIALALGVSRVSFFQWTRGNVGKSERWTAACQKAKQICVCFLEQSLISGKISPPSGIFLLKNVGDYHDTFSFEEGIPLTQTQRALEPDDWKSRFLSKTEEE